MVKTDLNTLRSYFEEQLDQLLLNLETPIEMLKPMLYSLQNGGKRLRPLLLLSVLDAESSKLLKKGVTTAIALEFIHTYSLIHDDLPAMDNDILRRGQPTSHVKFDEATAILAGDALLTDAFGLIAEDEQLKNKQKVKIVSDLSTSAGSYGMVAGQLNDIRSEGKEIELSLLQKIHYYKTGKLFVFAIKAAIAIAELDKKTSELLLEFAETFGVAYQIHNDIIDIEPVDEQSDKQSSSDQLNEKSTYPALLGAEGAKDALNTEKSKIEKSIRQLVKQKGESYEILSAFLDFIDLDRK